MTTRTMTRTMMMTTTTTTMTSTRTTTTMTSTKTTTRYRTRITSNCTGLQEMSTYMDQGPSNVLIQTSHQPLSHHPSHSSAPPTKPRTPIRRLGPSRTIHQDGISFLPIFDDEAGGCVPFGQPKQMQIGLSHPPWVRQIATFQGKHKPVAVTCYHR